VELIKATTEYSASHLGFQDLKTDILIGSKLDKFVPNINFNKWSDECWLNINYPIPITGEKEVYSTDSVQITDKNNETHKFYMTSEGELEYEIILPAIPLSNKFIFNLTFPDGLNFYYQPELTDTEKIDCYRPDNVVGSYAVYWNKKNNQYQTGKFCHIYRPHVVDATGNSIWGELFIDSITKTMTITIDPIWLSKAIYPVIIDPTIGYNVAGASQYGLNVRTVANRFNCSASGDANPGTFYVYGKSTTSQSWLGGAYEVGDGDISGNAKLNTSDAALVTGTSAAWVSGAITWTGLVSGTNYFLAVACDAIGDTIYYDSVTAGYEDAQYDDNQTTLPNPFGTRNGVLSYECSMYIDYTAAGGDPEGSLTGGKLIRGGLLRHGVLIGG